MSRHRPIVLGFSWIAAFAVAFVAGRLSVVQTERGPEPVRVDAENKPPVLPGSGLPNPPAERQVLTPTPAPPPAEPGISTAVTAPVAGDPGIDALNRLLEKTRDAQAMEPRVVRYLQPTLDQALADKRYNPRALVLSSEERAKFLEWVDGFDAVVKRLATECEEFTYREVLRRLAAGNELWIQAASEADVVSALKDRQGTDFVVQTDFASRETVAAHLSARFPKLSLKTLSTGGSRDFTTRITVFVEGDGSRVMETAKALDEAQRFRTQAIRDYLHRLPR